MQTIGQALGSQAAGSSRRVAELPEGNIGLELELESPRPFRDVRGWARKADGSLRDGVEYVFDGPAGGEVALHRIMDMGEYLRGNPPEPTFRCSTHIHLDVRDLTFEQYDRLVIAYALFEHVLFDHCSPYRRYSNFCTPFFINDGLLSTFQRGFRSQPHPGHKLAALSNWPKYSAMNLKVTRQYGSVEFRGSHALVTSEELLGLAQRVLHLRRLVLETRADTHIAFVEALRTMTLAEAFPQGLNIGYAQDPESEDIGYSNALWVASSAWVYDERRTRPFSDWTEGIYHDLPRMPPARRPETTYLEINRRVLDLYNIDPTLLQGISSTRKTIQAIVQVYTALGSIRGITPPSFGDLLSPPQLNAVLHSVEVYEGVSRELSLLLPGADIPNLLATTQPRQ